MIRMEMIRTGKETAENRLKKYQQALREKEGRRNEQHSCGKSVRGRCDTAD